MPRKKITVEDAFAQIRAAQTVLGAAGINVDVSVQSVEPEPQPSSLPKDKARNAYGSTDPHYTTKPATHVKVTLYAKHTVGGGGEIVIKSDGTKTVVNNGIITYGPGVVNVPVSLAKHLLHQDALAQSGDERFLSREQRHVLVIEKRDNSGNRSVIGVQVPEDVLDAGAMLTQLPGQYTFKIG